MLSYVEPWGRVTLFGSDNYAAPACYHARIDFLVSGAGTSLVARSEYGMTAIAALQQAIERAEAIRRQFRHA
jgi:hypothetical protein